MPIIEARLLSVIASVSVVVLLSFGTILTVSAPAWGATGEIDGTVVGEGGSPALVGATVTVIDSGNSVVATAVAGAGGVFTTSPLSAGAFSLIVHADGLWIDSYLNVTLNLANPTSGSVGTVELAPGRLISGIVKDAASHQPLADAYVTAVSTTTHLSYFGVAEPTKLDGLYEIVVPLDDTYEVNAIDFTGLHYAQYWDHSPDCGCAASTLIVVPPGSGPAIDGIDFDLWPVLTTLWVSIFASQDDASHPGGADYDGLRVELWKKVAGTWKRVYHDVTAVDGFVDVYGQGDGSYRLRFASGGTYVPVQYVDDLGYGPFPISSDGCYVSLGTQAIDQVYGTVIAADLSFDTLAEPCVGGGATPGGPGTPRSSPVTTPDSASSPTPSPSEMPTATPSATPTPPSSPEPEPTTSPSPHLASADVSWLFWLLAILLVLGVVVAIGVIVRRR